jgi:hypothetical protein
MQFLKSSVLLILAFAKHASAAQNCIPPGGICDNGATTLCCTGACVVDPGVGHFSGYVSTLSAILELMASNTLWRLVPPGVRTNLM